MTVDQGRGLGAAIDSTRVLACLECGKCTAICPAHRAHPAFSPRDMVKEGMMCLLNELPVDESMWHCITCRLCKEVCVSDVDIPEFVRTTRGMARERGNRPLLTHDGIVHITSELQEDPALDQDRLWWLEDDMDVHVDGEGDVLLFTGCSPYYDIIFREFDRTAEIPAAAVRVLNALGVTPVLLSNERCCGHDNHWTGDVEGFERLRDLNTEMIERSGPDTIVSPCPECALTLTENYDLDAEVVPITSFVSRRLGDLGEGYIERDGLGPHAYHDPCRLGRYLGDYRSPRDVLAAISDEERRELPFEAEIGQCCGVSAWINCTEGSRRLRYSRLKQAEEAGAGLLVTACPKCRIHFNCYLSNENVEPVDVEVEDLTVLLARSLGVFK